jgi:hypothetical protein
MYDETKRTSPTQTRIKWARGLSNDEMCDFLQGKLLEARAERSSQVSLLTELVHEIKHRLSVTDYDFRRGSHRYDDESDAEED